MLQSVAEIGWLALLVTAITLPIGLLTKWGQATEVNLIWYAFSFVLVIRLAVDFAAYISGYQSLHIFLEHELGIPSRYTLSLHNWLTNIHDELLLIATIVVVTITPQLVTYGLAGLFGCAKSPPLVWYFEKFAAWSLIKFLAALSGILFEETISPTGLQGFPFATTQSRQQALWALTTLAFAFIFAVIQTRVVDIAEDRAQPAVRIRWPRRLHRFFTRNLPPAASRPDRSYSPRSAPAGAGKDVLA